jgi:hypothetical protein
MTDARGPGVVVDTMVTSWLLDDRPNLLADRYRDLIGSQPVLVAFQTVMELRFGALRAGGASCGAGDSNVTSQPSRSFSPTTT